MKVLFVGDVHNHSYMFQEIEKLDKLHNFDKVIFLGDYVDDWSTDNHNSLSTLDTVINLKNSNRDKYTFLLGNHELSYLGFPCSGHMTELEDVMKMQLELNIECFDMFTTIQLDQYEYVCSHAGFTNGFVNEYLGGTNWKLLLSKMNEDKLHNLDILTKCSYLRGGIDSYSSFVWADKREHKYFSTQEQIIPHQIVGHTPVPEICLVDGIFFTDTHSTYPDGKSYGDGTYLFWNNRGFEILSGKELV